MIFASDDWSRASDKVIAAPNRAPRTVARAALGFAAVLAFTLTANPFAQAQSPDQCVDQPAGDPAVRIEACSDYLESRGRSDVEKAAALVQRGNAYVAAGSPYLASNDFNEAVALAPTQPAGYAGRASIAFVAGQPESALSDLNRAIQLSPSDPTLYISRSAVYMAIGEPAKAVADLDRSISLTPQAEINARFYLERGRANSAAGRTKEAISDFTTVLKRTGYSRNALLGRALLFENILAYRDALNDYNTIIENEIDDFEMYFRRGNIYMLIGEDMKAFDDFSHSIRLSPNFPPPYLFRGIIQGRMNNFEAALADLSRSIALGENAEAYLMRGSIYAETGRLAEASGDIDRSLQLKPGLPDAIRAREAIREALSTAQD